MILLMFCGLGYNMKSNKDMDDVLCPWFSYESNKALDDVLCPWF